MHYRGPLGTLSALSAWLLVVWLLASCSSTPPSETGPQGEELLSREAVEARIKSLVDEARASQSPQRERYLLEAADLLVDQQEFDWARNLLSSIDSRQLDPVAFRLHTELLGTLALDEGSYYLAERILTNPRLEQQWSEMSPEREIALRELRAQLFNRTGQVIASVKERIQLDSLLAEEISATENREALWQGLMSLSREELETASDEAEERQLQGWLNLAAISKNNQANLERQQSRIDQWQSDWPDHPANRHLPNDLQLLRKMIEQQPRQVALLLPEEGTLARAADAVRDGFLAAYYRSQQEQSRVPQIRQYNTSGDTDILDLYEQAIAEGADLIIGPLDKEKVQRLYEQPDLPIPVLTLNYIDAPMDQERPEAPEGLYQFGLAAEDEARQVARRAYQEGRRNAMILAPDRNWSSRSAQAFTEEWRALGGEISIDSQFSGTDDYSSIIQQALLIDQSQARRQAVTRLLGSYLEFEPRRRQDIDMIFLMAEPGQGRQIRPTLAFHYAGGLPVYATSHIYTGEQDTKSNRDLNGIRFNTLPWLLGNHFEEKATLAEHANAPAIYGRLHALGVDAYRLYPRLPQLEQVEDARLYGATGALRMRPGSRIERELVWARFQGGEALPLVTVTPRMDTQEEQDNEELQPPGAR